MTPAEVLAGLSPRVRWRAIQGSLGTWKAIQQRASRNAEFYETAFWFIPRSAPRPEVQARQPNDMEKDSPFASLCPTWQYDN
jgi:hypothetical protein